MRVGLVLGEAFSGLRRNASMVISVVLVTFVSLTFVGAAYARKAAWAGSSGPVSIGATERAIADGACQGQNLSRGGVTVPLRPSEDSPREPRITSNESRGS